jgi:hypothetical protein
MGLHRSGTSILYKMLGETGNFTIFTIYHILEYDKLLYYHANNLEEEKKRKINNLQDFCRFRLKEHFFALSISQLIE